LFSGFLDPRVGEIMMYNLFKGIAVLWSRNWGILQILFFAKDNEFSGTILTEIGALTKLDALLLCDNDSTGTIPTELDNLLVQSRGT
jgi:hypothetical protein